MPFKIVQQTRVYPHPSGRPNPKMGAPDPENTLFQGLSVLRGGLRPWSQTMVSEGARGGWGRGRSGDSKSTQGMLHLNQVNSGNRARTTPSATSYSEPLQMGD